MKFGLIAAALSLALAACSGENIYRSQPPVQSTGAAGGASGRGTQTGSSGSGTSAGGSSTGLSSGTPGRSTAGLTCNQNPGGCPPADVPDPLDLCGAGQVELVANLVDFVSGEGPISCPITLTDVYNPALSATTDLCGYIRYCVAPGTQISFSAQVSGYIPMDFATVQLTQSTQIPNRPGIPMANSGFLTVLKNLLPNADPSAAMVVIQVQPLDPTPSPEAGVDAQACADKAGWQLWLVDPQGDVVDAGLAYLVNDTLNPSALSTDTTGYAFFYNLDPAAMTVQPRGLRPRDLLSDGGVRCVNPEVGPPLELTGSVPVSGSVLSVIPYVVGAVGEPTDGGVP
jgi:hypothetical protein